MKNTQQATKSLKKRSGSTHIWACEDVINLAFRHSRADRQIIGTAMSNWPHSLICQGKDGEDRIFWYELARDELYPETVVRFRVHKSNPPRMNAESWFEMALNRCEDGTWKITFIGDIERRPHYTAVGIPDALIPEASRVLGAAIRSSSNIKAKKESAEFHTVDAEKMWDRLRSKGLAHYIPPEDNYICGADLRCTQVRKASI
jgi:hypothetical protein